MEAEPGLVEEVADGLSRPVYRVGRDVSAWPMAKLARAREHAQRLLSQVDLWSSTAQMQVANEFTDDRMTWRLRLRLASASPLMQWSTSLGDVVHNVRSSLDAAIWQFAAMDGAQSPPKRDLMFPIVTDESKWDAAVRKRLSGVPSPVVARVKLLQPFGVPEEHRRQHPLVWIQSLSSADKHQASVHCRCRPTEVAGSLSVEFGDEEAATRNTPPGFEFAVPELSDGALLGEWKTLDPIVDTKAEFTVSFEPVVRIDEKDHPLAHVMTAILEYVNGSQLLMHGGANPDRPPNQEVVLVKP